MAITEASCRAIAFAANAAVTATRMRWMTPSGNIANGSPVSAEKS